MASSARRNCTDAATITRDHRDAISSGKELCLEGIGGGGVIVMAQALCQVANDRGYGSVRQGRYCVLDAL